MKDPLPKFSGDTCKSIEWSKKFLRFSVRWRFSKALCFAVEVRVSDHTKKDRYHKRGGIDSEKLYETQNAWHTLLDAAGTPEVSRRRMVQARTPSASWLTLERRYRSQDTATIGHVTSNMQSVRLESNGDPLAPLF